MSGFLLDTNLVSELIKPRPKLEVRKWVDSVEESLLYLSVLTLGEIRKGIAVLPDIARKQVLELWLQNDLQLRFSGRILSVDEGIADRWGWIAGKSSASGRPLAVIDGLLAATALHHNMTLVTRNAKDVFGTGVIVFSPWDSSIA